MPPPRLTGTAGADLIDQFALGFSTIAALSYARGDRDTIRGGLLDDTMLGSSGGDLLIGNAGADILRGGAGADTLSGGVGDDLVRGGARDDVFVVHAGTGGLDTLFGGAGADRLVLHLTTAQALDAAIQAELVRLNAYFADPRATGGDFTSLALGIVFTNASIEALDIVVDGPIALSSLAAGSGGFKIIGENTDDQSGIAVGGAGDVNGDGLADVLVGAYFNDNIDPSANNGAAYVVFGGSGGATVDLDSVAGGAGGFKILGEGLADQAGFSVSGAGDVNGDGLADVLIGALYNDSTGGRDSGAAYVVFGKAGSGTVDLVAVAAGAGGFKIAGEAASDLAGISVSAAGDVNGDGLADLLVGASEADSDGSLANGAAFVVFGKAGGASVDLGAVALGSGGFKILGEDQVDVAGFSVSGAGDVNGDGLADLLVGAFQNDNAGSDSNGAGYVVFGKADGTTIDLDDVAAGTGTVGFKILGETTLDLAGYAVAGAGDVNGDGLADVLVGAWGNDTPSTSNSGASYVVFGKADGAPVDLDAVAIGTGGFKIQGEANDDRSGYAVSAAGDVNGDGLADLLVGAWQNDSLGLTDNGAVYLVFGKTDGATIDLGAVATGAGGRKILGEADGDGAGSAVAAAGDVNGDGLADLLVGAPYNSSDGSSDNGASYVIFGSADWLG